MEVINKIKLRITREENTLDEYEFVEKVDNNLILVKNNESRLLCFVDTNGEIVVPCIYKYANSSRDRLVEVSTEIKNKNIRNIKKTQSKKEITEDIYVSEPAEVPIEATKIELLAYYTLIKSSYLDTVVEVEARDKDKWQTRVSEETTKVLNEEMSLLLSKEKEFNYQQVKKKLKVK